MTEATFVVLGAAAVLFTPTGCASARRSRTASSR